jgi:hypothetical protein
VNLVEPADLLRPLQVVDDAAVRAGTEHHEAVFAEPEAGSGVVPTLFRLRLAGR